MSENALKCLKMPRLSQFSYIHSLRSAPAINQSYLVATTPLYTSSDYCCVSVISLTRILVKTHLLSKKDRSYAIT